MKLILNQITLLSKQSEISILQSNKGFCLYVCLYVCVPLNNSGTAEPIWINFFLLAPSWSRDGFRLKKIGFSENPENPILAGNFKTFLQKYSNFHVKNLRNNNAKQLYQFSNILSSEAEGQSHFQKRRNPAPLAAGG